MLEFLTDLMELEDGAELKIQRLPDGTFMAEIRDNDSEIVADVADDLESVLLMLDSQAEYYLLEQADDSTD